MTVCIAFCLTTLIALYTQMGAYYRAPLSTLAPDAGDRLGLELHDAPNADSNALYDPQVLIVSAFFPLAKSKHPMSDYEAWLTHFLTPIASDIYKFEYVQSPMADTRMIHGTNEHMTIDQLGKLSTYFGRLVATAAAR